MRAGDHSRGIHNQQPRRHVPGHFFAQPLRLFRALFFDFMEPFQFLFLFAELLNHALHRRRHERRGVRRTRRACCEFLSLSLTPNLKRLAHQKHHQPRDHQEPYSESRGNHPKVLRIIPGLQCCQHPSRLPTPSSLPVRFLCVSALSFSLLWFFSCLFRGFELQTLNFGFNSLLYPTIPLKAGHCAAITGPPYTIASAPIPRNVPSGNWYCLAIAHRKRCSVPSPRRLARFATSLLQPPRYSATTRPIPIKPPKTPPTTTHPPKKKPQNPPPKNPPKTPRRNPRHAYLQKSLRESSRKSIARRHNRGKQQSRRKSRPVDGVRQQPHAQIGHC